MRGPIVSRHALFAKLIVVLLERPIRPTAHRRSGPASRPVIMPPHYCTVVITSPHSLRPLNIESIGCDTQPRPAIERQAGVSSRLALTTRWRKGPIGMPSITIILSTCLDAVLRQTAASRGRSREDVVKTAVSQYLNWRDFDRSSSVIRLGNIELDPARRLVRRKSALVRLTPTEFDLLHYLMAHAGLAMTHARLLGAVWSVEYGGELEYLRIYVRQLRKRLEDDSAEPKYLLTDSHHGYRFADVTMYSKGGTHPEPAARLR